MPPRHQAVCGAANSCKLHDVPLQTFSLFRPMKGRNPLIRHDEGEAKRGLVGRKVSNSGDRVLILSVVPAGIGGDKGIEEHERLLRNLVRDGYAWIRAFPWHV